MPLDISVILPTRNRAKYLSAALSALERQTLSSGSFEVVAVDDGSTDDTAAILEAAATRLPLRRISIAPSGIAIAKSIAVFAASAPVVVFADDDDILVEGALEAHLAAHQRYPGLGDAVLGLTRLSPDCLKSPLMQYVAGVGGQLFFYGDFTSTNTYDWRAFWGGRSSCKREFLVKYGVFDPRFTFGYEDTELGYRLRRHALTVHYEPAARSEMIRVVSFDAFAARSYRQGVAAHVFHAIHPDPEIGVYLDIDAADALWRAEWRGYARIIKEGRAALFEPDPERRHALWGRVFRYSYAKGLADARFRAASASHPEPAGPGLDPNRYAAAQRWLASRVA